MSFMKVVSLAAIKVSFVRGPSRSLLALNIGVVIAVLLYSSVRYLMSSR
jgi:hypothetical protein